MVNTDRLLSAYSKAVLVFMTVISINVCYAGYDNSSGPTRRELASDRPGFISIDCGGTEEYTDYDLGIHYVTDSGFIDAGVPMSISTVAGWGTGNLTGTWQHLQTLRSFPHGKKNCYKLKPEQGKNRKYLIRAMFWYGNYDGLNKAPEFQVYIGANLWDTVSGNDTNEEIIYSPTTDAIFVCLVNIEKGVPYINALELRLLDNSIYQTLPHTALTKFQRKDLGKSYDGWTMWRRRDDAYDRLWHPLHLPDTELRDTEAVIREESNNLYKPPASVLRDGVISVNVSTPLTQSLDKLDANLDSYIFLHFAEIESHEGMTRENNIYLNDKFYATINLDYLQQTTFSLDKPIRGILKFSIKAGKDYDLPPLLNAYEVYQATYGIMKDEWQGDPCLVSYTWSGLVCNRDNPPRIISLDMKSHNLTGVIAPSIANLTVLEYLDLSDNELNGTVPEFLASLPSLKAIDLKGNNLSCSLPQSIIEKQNNGILALSLCGDKMNHPMPVIAVSVASALVIVVILVVIMVYLWRRRRTMNEGNSSRDLSFKKKARAFKSSELVSITNDFKNVIGEGGFGKVYHGILKDGSEVAIKMLSASSRQGIKEFRVEAEILTKIHHRNLVSLVGYCDDGHNMALIYEFMSNGNLRHHISGSTKNVLSWKDRLIIAVDSSRGIEYLHSGCKPPIVHRDLKSSNILLDDKFHAKIADFGISRMFADESDTSLMTTLVGTLGYLDPEYHSTGKLNMESDVYGFGIVLLELITGKSSIIEDSIKIHIRDWIKNLLEKGDIEGIVDARLDGNYSTNSAWKVVEIAMACVSQHAVQRPDISYVHSELKECLKTEVGSKSCREINANNTMSSTSGMDSINMDVAVLLPEAR